MGKHQGFMNLGALVIGCYLIGSVIGLKLCIGIGFLVWVLLPWE